MIHAGIPPQIKLDDLINNKYNDKDTIPIGDLAGTVTHNWNTKNIN